MQEQLPITPWMACIRAMQEQLPRGLSEEGVKQALFTCYNNNSHTFNHTLPYKHSLTYSKAGLVLIYPTSLINFSLLLHILMLPIDSHTFTNEENSHFLRQILQFINTHRIAPNPINYTICYEYISGNNKDLAAAIDLLIKQKKPIDNDISLKLYNKFVYDTSYQAFDDINQNLELLIDSTKSSIAETSQKASDAGVIFEEQADSMTSVQSTDDLKQAISQAAAGANGLADITKSLQTELDSAKQEMEQLRTELVKVKKSASTDALTGLLNRGAFDKELGNLLSNTGPLNACLTMLDLDHFKKVNDTHGHLIGDNVLKITASLLKKHAEPQHYVARYGGEELAIIMPDTSLKKAVEISEKIRISLAKTRLKKKSGSEPIGQITVSIGISKLKQNDTAEDAIMRADKALYEAKETGRNKVVCEA